MISFSLLLRRKPKKQAMLRQSNFPKKSNIKWPWAKRWTSTKWTALFIHSWIRFSKNLKFDCMLIVSQFELWMNFGFHHAASYNHVFHSRSLIIYQMKSYNFDKFNEFIGCKVNESSGFANIDEYVVVFFGKVLVHLPFWHPGPVIVISRVFTLAFQLHFWQASPVVRTEEVRPHAI